MGDEGMDPCECVWSHEMAMRRLLSFLRQSQSHCTDTECFDELHGPTQMPENNFFMMGLIVFAVIMYLTRSHFIRGASEDNMKPRHDGAGSSDGPPTPPPAAC